MFVKTVLAAAVLATSVAAHTNVRGFYISGQGQAYPTKDWDYCVRPISGSQGNNPLTEYSGKKFQCNDYTGPAAGTCEAMPGDEVTMVIHEHSMTEDYAVGGAHHGPIQAYLAKVDNAATTGVTGLKWFKIFSRGLIHGGAGRNGIADNVDDPSMQYWATNVSCWMLGGFLEEKEANKNKGLVKFNLPTDLAPGDYLLRGELIALHNAGSPGGAQPYVSCAQLRVGGNGNGNPSTVTDISYSTSDPGLLLAIYYPMTSYTPPGPAVYVAGSGGTGNPTTTTTRQPTTTTTTTRTTTTTTRGPITTTPGQCSGGFVTVTQPGNIVTVTEQGPTVTVTASGNTDGTGSGPCASKYGQCGGIG
uniref:lytic cellulose monooxygenase (C4-dehydrogenating) n=1 Tax=Rhizophlyctis rosea TaxID=64517 RepID=A0A2U8U9V6_9FUNG|nr:lytic polysaccharide monooxygenase 9 [Rhizophlyctis rosea]